MVNIGEISALSRCVIGRDPYAIDESSLECPVHREVVAAIKSIKLEASEQGFDLRIASAYRSFDRQLAIWNQKAKGFKPVLDEQENVLNLDELSPTERIFAILRWTALPGASRHHWGSDFDIYDARALASGDTLKLTQAETKNGGVFEPFYTWLDKFLDDLSCDFFRPYAFDRGGVAPEPWHLSYRPVSSLLQNELSIELLLVALQDVDIFYSREIKDNIDEIYHRFVLNVNQ